MTLVGAGDIASSDRDNKAVATAALLQDIPGTVYTLGDNVQGTGNPIEFTQFYDNYRFESGAPYDPSRPAWWGQQKDRTMPTLGNHEYIFGPSVGLPAVALPYFGYFGAVAPFKPPAASVPDPGLTVGKGYYSYDRGSWHIVVLNSNCSKVGGCGEGSPQLEWLKNDLAGTTNKQCTLAYFHHPLYATGNNTDTPQVKPFWRTLYDGGADVILSGHAHRYERYAPITPNGEPDPDYGIRQFVVGTGGEPGGSEINYEQAPGVQVVETGTSGVLKLELGTHSYSWEFVPIAGKTFTDSGSDSCHAIPDTTPPEIIGVPADMNVAATSSQGAIVDYTLPTATDDVDGPVPVSCTPGPNTLFPLGSTPVNCTATDRRGNTASKSFMVKVTYAWSGVLKPIDGSSTADTSDDNSIFKLGSTVPVKFRLAGESARITDATAKLHVAKVSEGIVGDEVEAVSTAASSEGNHFRYDPEEQQYIFNWSTKGLESGTYRLTMDLSDGTAENPDAINHVLVSLK